MTIAYTTVSKPEILAGQRRVTGTITFDASYPTGGEAFSAVAVGLTQLTELTLGLGIGASGVGYPVVWNRSTSAPLLLVMIGDYNNGTDGPLIQAGDTTDLSALVVPFTAIGY